MVFSQDPERCEKSDTDSFHQSLIDWFDWAYTEFFSQKTSTFSALYINCEERISWHSLSSVVDILHPLNDCRSFVAINLAWMIFEATLSFLQQMSQRKHQDDEFLLNWVPMLCFVAYGRLTLFSPRHKHKRQFCSCRPCQSLHTCVCVCAFLSVSVSEVRTLHWRTSLLELFFLWWICSGTVLLPFLNQNFNGKHPQPRTNNQKPTSNNHQSTSSTTPTTARTATAAAAAAATTTTTTATATATATAAAAAAAASSLPPRSNNSKNYNIIHNVINSSYTATTIQVVAALLALECNVVFFSRFRKKDLYPATIKASKMARSCWAQVSSRLGLCHGITPRNPFVRKWIHS